jgi:hypothetical protein
MTSNLYKAVGYLVARCSVSVEEQADTKKYVLSCPHRRPRPLNYGNFGEASAASPATPAFPFFSSRGG